MKKNRSTILVELAKSLISKASIDDLSFSVLNKAKEMTGSEFGYVGYIDPSTGYLVSSTLTRDIWEQCSVHEKEIVFKKFVGLWGWVLQNKQPLFTNSPQDDPRSTGTPKGHIDIKRFLSVPAMIGEKLAGQISLANSKSDYTEEDIEIISDIASFYALAIEREVTERALEASEVKYSSLYSAMSEGMCLHELLFEDDITAIDYKILDVNPSYEKILDLRKQNVLNKKGSEVYNTSKPPYLDIYSGVVLSGEPTSFESYYPPLNKYFHISVFTPEKNIFATVFTDITTSKKLSQDKEKLIGELKKALAEVKTLRGILPICTFCKKIRNDKGYWEQVELYVHKHANVQFSHGFCPECMKKNYPEYNLLYSEKNKE